MPDTATMIEFRNGYAIRSEGDSWLVFDLRRDSAPAIYRGTLFGALGYVTRAA